MTRRSLAVSTEHLGPVAPFGCKDCAFLRTCGGLEGQQNMFGCFAGCGSCGVERGVCDYSCPRKPDFWKDWVEVGGLNPKQSRVLPPLDVPLPRYVPMIRHGYSRAEPLPSDVVALNSFEVIDSACRSRDPSPISLRERFLISPKARVLLVSVKQDRFVENFWAQRDAERLAALTRLDLAAMTTPNFSLFDDAPRMHSVRNLWRILRAAEDLAGAGIIPILHVNALSREDWQFWARVLRENPAVTHVCKEFQTGLSDPTRAADAVDGLRWLQDEVGRALHPLVVGGRRVAHDVGQHFASFTVIDSVPFFATIKRRRIVVDRARVSQIENPTDLDENLDGLLQDNLRTYDKLVATCIASRKVDVPAELDEEADDADLGQDTQ